MGRIVRMAGASFVAVSLLFALPLSTVFVAVYVTSASRTRIERSELEACRRLEIGTLGAGLPVLAINCLLARRWRVRHGRVSRALVTVLIAVPVFLALGALEFLWSSPPLAQIRMLAAVDVAMLTLTGVLAWNALMSFAAATARGGTLPRELPEAPRGGSTRGAA